jgi:Ca2+-binding RTX toxin-like protein
MVKVDTIGLLAAQATDEVYAGSEPDEVYGGLGNDYIKGEGGNDTIRGQENDDVIYGDEDNDTLYGGTQNDTLYGGTGWDTLRGEADDDTLYGEERRDILWGDQGNDILNGGGIEPDNLRGGPGNDTFQFDSTALSSNLKIDVIEDFNQGNTGALDASEKDSIDLSPLLGAAFNGGNGETFAKLVNITFQTYDGMPRALLQVDLDGTGSSHVMTPLAYINGVTPGTNFNVILDPNHAPQNGSSGTPDAEIPVLGAPGSWTITPISQTVREDEGTISFVLKRPTTDQPETVYISTTVNQHHANNGDYDYWLNEPVTLAAGEDEYTVNIHINNDNHDEVIETFGLIIQSSPSQPASEYLKQATFSIIDDDLAGSSATFTPNNDLVWIEPSGGTKYFNGLAGTDTATLNLTAWSAGISSSTSGSTRIFSRGSDSLRFDDVENFFVIGGSGNDNLSAGNGTNGLFGGAGNDTLYAGTGFDILDGGAGDDSFHNVGYGDFVAGGTGTDTVNFNVSEQTEDITINLATSQGAGASWTGVERVSGSLGSGNDTVVAGLQLGSIYGSGGMDEITLDYSGTLADGRTATKIVFNYLARSGFPEYVYLSDGTRSDVYFDAFERFHITATQGDDEIYAGSATESNVFYGLAGNDTLTSGAGGDFLDGGEGDDTFNNVGIGDTVVGGAGTDTVNFNLSAATQDITIDLSTGGVSGVSWTGIERVSGSLGSGNDTVVAGLQLGSIYDYGGMDEITLDYSGTLADGRTATKIVFNYLARSGFPEYVYLSDGTTSSVYFDAFERFNITATVGDDVINAGSTSESNVFYGLAGNDSLTGGSGNDVLDGGRGNDNLNGGNGDDLIKGINLDDTTPGLGEIDTLTGGAGADRFILGDMERAGYDDQDTATNGTNDYALITDLNTAEDSIQLHGVLSDYLLQVSGSDTQLFINKPAGEADELIGILRGVTWLSLDTKMFSFINDTDGDGIADHEDNAILVANPDQRDTDGDGYGNIVDADLNNDMTINFADLSLMKQRFFSADADADLDGNGSVNFADLSILKSMFFKPPGDSYVDHLDENVVASVESVTEPVTTPAIELVGVSADPFWG